MFQNGREFLQKGFKALVPIGYNIPFVATRQTTTEGPEYSARFDTVCHSNKETGVAGRIEAYHWRRKS
jgi:hypothetical protein